MPLWQYLEHGGLRGFYVWHRRAGKDDLALHWTALAAHRRVGTYWYMLPQQAQGRKAIWEAVNPKTGKRRIDEAFPDDLRARTSSQEMFIQLKCGSTWQVVGSDNFNSLVGSPPVGLVMSEWALAKQAAWAYLRPILRENGGWALFNTTPRGKNHAYTMMQAAKSDPAWFAQILTARQTSVFTPEQLEAELAEYKREFGDAVGEQMFEQEYLCSFEQPVVGAIYAAELRAAREQGRIGRVPYDPLLPVHTWWDIGGAGQGGDATGVWFIQKQRAEVRAIRYHESTGKALPYYAKYCTELPYRYGTHWFPHDARAKSLGSGRSIEELAGGYYDPTTGEQVPGMLPGEVKISPAVNVEDRINAGRSLFPRMWFDETNCADGLDALSNYRREWKDKLMQLNAAPLHDWSSHGADAYGEIALTEQQTGAAKPKKPDLSKRLGGSGWA